MKELWFPVRDYYFGLYAQSMAERCGTPDVDHRRRKKVPGYTAPVHMLKISPKKPVNKAPGQWCQS